MSSFQQPIWRRAQNRRGGSPGCCRCDCHPDRHFAGHRDPRSVWRETTTSTADCAKKPSKSTAASDVAKLWNKLAAYGVAERSCFAHLSVFGRTLKAQKDSLGRDHWPLHNTAIVQGPSFRGGVARWCRRPRR